MTDLTSAEVVAHSVWEDEPLVSFRATCPSVVQYHLLRHRAFSFSFASMRAIPTKKIIEQVEANPFIPSAWPKNKSGMSAVENIDAASVPVAELTWEAALRDALYNARCLSETGVHKEIVNRLLAPFAYTTCIISTTMPGLENFFAQRIHPDAQPEMQLLARKMREALEASTPVEQALHIPFGTPSAPSMRTVKSLYEEEMIRAISKCARVSYGRELEERSFEEDKGLVVRLARDKHFSPFEHVGFADYAYWDNDDHSGNFRQPWNQARHHLEEVLPSIAAELGA